MPLRHAEGGHLTLWQWVYLVLVVASALAVGALAYGLSRENQRIGRDERSTAASLCAYRHNLDQQIAATRQYLREHPGAEPIPGVSRATLVLGLRRSETLRTSFSSLDCG